MVDGMTVRHSAVHWMASWIDGWMGVGGGVIAFNHSKVTAAEQHQSRSFAYEYIYLRGNT